MENLFLYIGVYVFALLLLTFIVLRKQSKESFLIANRNRNSFQILCSKFATIVGAGWFLTFTGFAYEFGVGIFIMLIGMILGIFLFTYWAIPKIFDISKKNKFYTLGDFINFKTKSKSSIILTDIISQLGLLIWLVVGIIGAGKIISGFDLMSYNEAVIFSSLIVLIYVLIGGYRAVLLTDILQTIIIISLISIVTFGIVTTDLTSLNLNAEFESLNIALFFGLLIFGLFNSFARSDLYQLIYASKTKKDAIRGSVFSIIPIILIASLLFLIGIFVANLVQGLDPGLVFIKALESFLPQTLLPLAIVLFFAGVMSSADTNIYSISSHISSYTKKDRKKSIRISMIVLMVLITLFAVLFPDIIDMSIVAVGVTLILPIPIIYLIKKEKPNAKKFKTSVIVSLCSFLLGLLIFGIEPVIVLLPIITSSIVLLFKFK